MYVDQFFFRRDAVIHSCAPCLLKYREMIRCSHRIVDLVSHGTRCATRSSTTITVSICFWSETWKNKTFDDETLWNFDRIVCTSWKVRPRQSTIWYNVSFYQIDYLNIRHTMYNGEFLKVWEIQMYKFATIRSIFLYQNSYILYSFTWTVCVYCFDRWVRYSGVYQTLQSIEPSNRASRCFTWNHIKSIHI